jgi:hypothetical protein
MPDPPHFSSACLILLTSVLQAMPLYLFSALAAPKSILQAIRNIQRSFLWGGARKEKKWALVAWDKICLPKLNGGLGLRDPETLISILGAKTWWRWLTSKDALWTGLWQKKYSPQVRSQNLIRLTGNIT